MFRTLNQSPARTTSRTTILLLIMLVVLALAGVTWWLVAGGSDTAGQGSLETKTVEAGAVTVKLTPVKLDTTGAEFDLTMDTHTVALDMDLEGGSRLTIDAKTTAGAVWTGTGPGSHHREGTLRFNTAVPAGAAVKLAIDGLPEAVDVAWSAPGTS